jgi:hypothetical protein
MSSTNPSATGPIQSYAELQTYMNNMITLYGTSISSAPHHAFWNTLTYEQFTTGNVPGVNPPVKILEVGNGTGSNIVQALQGVGPLFGPNGRIGQMPADGTGPWTAEQIQPLIAWIDANCPNNG